MTENRYRNRDAGNPGHPTQFAAHGRSTDGVTLDFDAQTTDGLAARFGLTVPQLRATVADTDDQEMLGAVSRAQQLELARLAIYNPRITTEALRAAARTSFGHSVLVAEREPLSSQVQNDLLPLGPTVQRALASNFDAKPFALLILSKSDDAVTRAAVACNPSTSDVLLADLAKNDDTPLVREQVAANPNTPADTLANLYEGAGETLQAALATNPSVPLEIQRKLAASHKESVELALARRYGLHHTVTSILHRNTESEAVRSTLYRMEF